MINDKKMIKTKETRIVKKLRRTESGREEEYLEEEVLEVVVDYDEY